MYRIRKDIDLKELEKFGYRLVKDDGYHKAYIKNLKNNDYIAIFGDGTILIDVKDFCEDNFEELQNKLLHDLIEEGLIEIQIKNKYNKILYKTSIANTIKEALERAVEQGEYLNEANLEGSQLQCAKLSGADLQKINLEGADLFLSDLTYANLEGANLKNANLKDVNFAGANLKGANLEGANLYRTNFYGANLEDINLEGANLYRPCFAGAYLYMTDNLNELNTDKLIKKFKRQTNMKSLKTYINKNVMDPVNFIYYYYRINY